MDAGALVMEMKHLGERKASHMTGKGCMWLVGTGRSRSICREDQVEGLGIYLDWGNKKRCQKSILKKMWK